MFKGFTNYSISTMQSGAGILDIFMSFPPAGGKHLKCLEILWEQWYWHRVVETRDAYIKHLRQCTGQPPQQRIVL